MMQSGVPLAEPARLGIYVEGMPSGKPWPNIYTQGPLTRNRSFGKTLFLSDVGVYHVASFLPWALEVALGESQVSEQGLLHLAF